MAEMGDVKDRFGGHGVGLCANYGGARECRRRILAESASDGIAAERTPLLGNDDQDLFVGYSRIEPVHVSAAP
jgi:hypothetical protein